MHHYFLLIFLFGCASGAEKAAEQNHSAESAQNKKTSTPWKKPDLTGHWKLVNFSEVKDIPFIHLYNDKEGDMAMEQGPFEYYRKSDLVFENNTVYRISYPIEVIEQGSYTLDTGYLCMTNTDSKKFYPIELKNDTLFYYVKGSYGPEYLKIEYIKTQFDDNTISILKKDTINYPELAGKWMLMRDYWYDYGTHYWLEFPHKIPDSIEISREQFSSLQKQKMVYYMRTDGQMRDYTVYYDYPYLHMTPGKWYKGDDPWIHFDQNWNEIKE